MNFLPFGSWKTASAGIASLLATVAHVAASGWQVDMADINGAIAGIGLIFAKDFNVTGSGSTTTTDKK